MFQDQTYVTQTGQLGFMHRVYAWMSCALAITAGIAWYVANNTNFNIYMQEHPLSLLGIFIGQLALVIGLTAMLNKMSYGLAITLFVLYAASLGVTLSVIFQVYTESSIGSTFLVAAATFGSMALYGYFTRTDLTRLQSILFMVLLGLIIASLVNMWLKNSMFELGLSVAGVVLFALLTAADVQKLKNLANAFQFDQDGQRKVAVVGALTLYLDFINLFLYLLRFMGNRKNQ